MSVQSVQCFWISPTHTVQVSLRRYRAGFDTDVACAGPFKYHNAKLYVGLYAAKWHLDTDLKRYIQADGYSAETAGMQWPTTCDYCDYVFEENDGQQTVAELLYRRTDTSELMTLRDAGPGAMWNAWWMGPNWQGPDGRSICVKCPNGHEWLIDSQASNCTMKDDHVHKCWVRHGNPPVLTVDKNGNTCNAGGGSIQAGDYHGFLQGGMFT